MADVDLSPAPDLVDVYLRLGRATEAAPLAASFAAEARAKGQPWALARAERALGMLGDDADRHFASALDLHANTSFPSVDPGKTDQLASRYDWLGTARGRVGYAVGQSLFYGTGGLAVARVKDTYGNEVNTGSAGYFATASNRVGWTAGAGWEYRITQNWGVKLEYLHVDLGDTTLDISAATTNRTIAFGGNPPGSSVLHFNNAFDLVRAGVNFKW